MDTVYQCRECGLGYSTSKPFKLINFPELKEVRNSIPHFTQNVAMLCEDCAEIILSTVRMNDNEYSLNMGSKAEVA